MTDDAHRSHFYYAPGIQLKAVTFSQNFQRMYGNFIAYMLYLHAASCTFGQDILGG
jgi:hypothetical protein